MKFSLKTARRRATAKRSVSGSGSGQTQGRSPASPTLEPVQDAGSADEQITELEAIRQRVANEDPWLENKRAAKQRIREDASRPLGVNLAEGLAHSEFLLSFVGILRKS